MSEENEVIIGVGCGFVGRYFAKAIAKDIKTNHKKKKYIFSKNSNANARFTIKVQLGEIKDNQIRLRKLSNIAIATKCFVKENFLQASLNNEELCKFPLIVFESFREEIEQSNSCNILAGCDDARTIFALVKEGIGVGLCYREHLEEMNTDGIVVLSILDRFLPEASLVIEYDCK